VSFQQPRLANAVHRPGFGLPCNSITYCRLTLTSEADWPVTGMHPVAGTPTIRNPPLFWPVDAGIESGGLSGGAQVAGATPYNLGVYGQPGIQASGYNSNYNSLQAEINRHFSNGLQIQAAYTWSRYFDEVSSLEGSAFNFPGVNPFSPANMYGPSQSDAPQRLVVNYTYTLPFYKFGHRWKRLTDDWNLSGIYTLQHGFPIPVFDLLAHSLTCDDNGIAFYVCPDRPDRTGAPLAIGNPRNHAINDGQN
jgi:hypothetical protein